MTGAAKDAVAPKHCCTLASLGRYAALDVKTEPYPVARLDALLGVPVASLAVAPKDATKGADSLRMQLRMQRPETYKHCSTHTFFLRMQGCRGL